MTGRCLAAHAAARSRYRVGERRRGSIFEKGKQLDNHLFLTHRLASIDPDRPSRMLIDGEWSDFDNDRFRHALADYKPVTVQGGLRFLPEPVVPESQTLITVTGWSGGDPALEISLDLIPAGLLAELRAGGCSSEDIPIPLLAGETAEG